MYLLLTSLTIQLFSQKIIRLTPRVSQREIDNEVGVVTSISGGGHKNIVTFLQHG